MSAPARHISRLTLFERLDEAVTRPVTVVSAPAGSGKSSLVRSWLTVRGATYRAGWVSVERGERNEQRFWSNLIDELRATLATLAASSPAVAVSSPARTPSYHGDTVVERLAAELSSLKDPLLLVIDDVHEIADSNIRSHFAYFLDHLPAALHVVLISRRDLQLGLHRRRLRGELAEIRNDDLHFTAAETRQLVGARGIALSDAGLGLLHERTEGWVTGVVLATVLLAQHPQPEQFIAEFSGSERTVAEYLLAEVLNNQPAHVRRLLLRASLLDRVNGALGDVLTAGFGSERQLRELADDGAFVVALDPQRTWFRFHRLFADLLAVELRHSEPEEVANLHLGVATWFAEHDLPVEAITHAQAAGDHQLAAGLLIQHYFTLVLDGRQAAAHVLLQAYRVDFLQNPPEIAAVLANNELAQGSLDQAAAHLGLAERDAERVVESERPTFDVALLLTRLTLARRRGDFQSVLAEVSAPDLFIEPRKTSHILVNNDLRTLMLMNLGIVEVWCGSLDSGAGHLRQARDLAQRGGRPYLEVGCLAHLTQAQLWQSFSSAREAAKQALALAEKHGWAADPVIAPALITLGIAFIQAGRLDDGERWLVLAGRTLSIELEPTLGYLMHMSYAGIHLGRGNPLSAVKSFREAERLGLGLVSGSPLVSQQRSGLLYSMLKTGEVDAVATALAAMSAAERDVGEIREVTAALALVAGHPDRALQALAPTIEGSATIHHPVVLIRSLILRALTLAASDQMSDAKAALERALEVAEPDTLILPFMFLPCGQLLQRHMQGATAHGAFIREILDALSGTPLGLEDAPVPQALDALSAAELRLLRYLPTNLTAAAVAIELNVATNTAKTHMRHIYAKLGAHTREEAVVRARALGLLGLSAHRG